MHSFIGYTSVTVTIVDRDDNDPLFVSSHYSATISESTPIGVTVISSVDSFDFDSVCILCVCVWREGISSINFLLCKYIFFLNSSQRCMYDVLKWHSSLIQGTNAVVGYDIESDNPIPFDIEPITGEIFTTAGFEYDGIGAMQSYTFKVR